MVTPIPQFGRSTTDEASDLTRPVRDFSSAETGAAPPAALVPVLLTELERRERHLAVRDAVLATIIAGSSPSGVLQRVLDEICARLACHAGAIHLLSGDGQAFELAAHVGLDAETVLALGNLPRSGWPLAEAVVGDGVLTVHHLHGQPGAPLWSRSGALHGWIAAPLCSPEGTLGVIWIGSRGDRVSVEQDSALLEAVARQIGVAIDSLRTRAEIEAALSERDARWVTLYNTGVAMTRELDSDALLDEIVRRSVDLLAGEGGVLSLLDEASGEMVIAVAYRRDAEPWPIRGRRVRAGEGINGAVLALRQPLIIENYAGWPGRVPELADQALSVVAVPLLLGDQVCGVLAVSDTAGRRLFTEDDVQTLTLFAQQATAVWERQRNRRQAEALTLHAERARLARDLHDGLAQDLASLLLRADLCQTLADGGNAALQANLETISSGLQRCIRDARATIFALRQPDVDTCSVEGNLAVQVSQFESQTHIPVRYTIEGEGYQPLPKTHEVALLRVAQEALSNVRKHAHATRAALCLTWRAGGSISLKITDDGVGFDQTAIPGVNRAGHHFGLVSMRERVEELGGSFMLQSSPGGGTCLEVRLSTPAGAG